ncbi:Armadillo-like helical [Penicillium samsonianum]|uniref:Armadillo-like helical n=1 Tax=Penicillium samsonianum TaxID=1882272 RepID=UPI002547A3B8|nr:Armadillo-like helical [Penicillium samsonianum]KAJ6138874.1 Armadillo-like helical [Penicillium samsonianum]
MEDLAQKVQLYSEKTLRDIAKGPLVKFTLTCQETEKVNRVWQSLVQTLSTASISPPHSAEACNAASAFIDAATKSQCDTTQRLIFSQEAWLSIFDICLTRYEDAKPKPVKKLLASVTAILAKSHQGTTRAALQTAIIDAIIPSIVLGEPQSRLKGCLVFLETFIRKDALLPSEFITLTRQWLLKNTDKWATLFANDHETLSQGESGPAFDTASGSLSDELAARIFVLGLLIQTNNRTMALPAGNVLAILIQKMKPETSPEKLSAMWVMPVRRIVLQNIETLEDLSNRLLQPLFTIDHNGFKVFLDTLPVKSLIRGDMTDAPEAEYMVLFAALQIGKKINLVHEDYIFNVGKMKLDKNVLVMKSDVIGNFLLHREANIRIAALSLLITAFSTVKPFTVTATNAILRGLPSMHAESDAYTRGEILSLTRKFFVRLRGGIVKDEDVVLETEKNANKPAQGQVRNETETTEFLKAYLKLLGNDLRLAASYSRHITALKALKLLLDSGLDPRIEVKLQKSEMENIWKVHVEVFDAHLLRLLVDLLLDPFEEVRQTALSILSLCPREILLNGLHNKTDDQSAVGMRLTDAITRAESLASNTSRADHADTVARLYHIVFCAALPANSGQPVSDWWTTKASVVDTILKKLEERLLDSKTLFHSAMREAPLHGYTSGLRYIVLMPSFHSLISDGSGSAAWRSVHDRIVAICDKIWIEAKPLLCIDSPEGHSDEPTEDLNVGPKDALSYSWRSLREASLLLHATMVNTSYGPSGTDGLNLADFANIGGVSFTQLAELRHRGAFSNVSQTFATCCQRCSSSKDPSIRELPRNWYQEAKSTIFGSASQLTRRSAGLPALVTGIVGSDPGTPFFNAAINELHEISSLPVEYDKERQYLELPQVHAMNCLKDIFTNAKLGFHTEPFIMKALTLSAERLGSPIWALRNSGLMLFRALLTKMCRVIPGAGPGFGGNSGSEPGSRITFPKYPGLLELLSGLLTTTQGEAAEGTEIITERVFPALELVGDKVPSLDDPTDEMLRGLVLQHLSSPVWGVREHAARVYASLLTRQHIPEDLRTLITAPSKITENYVHGVALCVRYALRRYSLATDDFWRSNLDVLFTTLRTVLEVLFRLGKSPTVASELVEILNGTMERAIQAQSEDQVISFINEMFEVHDLDGILRFVFDASQAGWNLSSTSRASALLRRALAWCTTLKMLTSQQWEQLPAFFIGVSQFDADVARWILEQLHESVGEDERYRQPLADLYSSVILGNSRPDVKTMAASNLASILENLISSQFDSVPSIGLPWDAIANGFRPGTDITAWNREATDAELRLRGCLLAIRSSVDQTPSSSFEGDVHSWTIKLRSALSEETEFTTRFAAAVSVGSFSRALRSPGSQPHVDAVLLDVYLVLYDMLNDDDDEIRDVAASAASWVLSHSSVSPDADVTLAPLNAGALLADFIIDNYSDSALLGQRVLRYLTSQEPRVSGSDERSHLVAVSDQIAEHRQESTVLFVEEKQNLFIDDVREVEVWSRALLRLTHSAYNKLSLDETSAWAFDGLTYLCSLVGSEKEADGLLGWVSKPEIFTLGLRVIIISSALGSQVFPAPESLRVQPNAFRASLESLLGAGKSSSVHGDWLSRIQAALEM